MLSVYLSNFINIVGYLTLSECELENESRIVPTDGAARDAMQGSSIQKGSLVEVQFCIGNYYSSFLQILFEFLVFSISNVKLHIYIYIFLNLNLNIYR